MTNQFPWRPNTTPPIAAEDDSRYETPGGAQAKADAAEQDAKEYTDAKLALPELPIANGSIVERHIRSENVSTRTIAQKAVTRSKIATGAVGSQELDPALLPQYGDIAINAKFEIVDAQIAENKHYIFGMEYLTHYYERLRANTPVKGIFSGDSTTAGDSVVSPANKIDQLWASMLKQFGYYNITAVNAGHSGMKTSDWVATYLAADLAQNPNLYVLRWGINDPYEIPFSQALVDTFETNLRSGLATLRASKSVENMSVILMAPNSTSDTPNTRDEQWHKAINPVIRKAARDYQCCFIDTFYWLADNRYTSGWGDNPYGDGRRIHPIDIGNIMIAHLMSEVLVPVPMRTYVPNISSDVLRLPVADLPSTYPKGPSIFRTEGDFPVDGAAYTFKQDDGCMLQFNGGYNSRTFMGFRIGSNIENVWGDWGEIHVGTPYTNITDFDNGWVNFDASHQAAQYKKDITGKVCLRGLIKNGTILPNDTILVLPAGFVPPYDVFKNVACQGGYAAVNISTDGGVRVLTVPNNTWLSLDGISFDTQ